MSRHFRVRLKLCVFPHSILDLNSSRNFAHGPEFEKKSGCVSLASFSITKQKNIVAFRKNLIKIAPEMNFFPFPFFSGPASRGV